MKGSHAVLGPAARLDWSTPDSLFRPLEEEFGFTLDVCANEHNAKCSQFYLPEQDGLTRDWGRHICWMNPPYGREIGAWIKKASEAANRGATVVCLIPARTDTAWWHDHVAKASERRFVRGRVKFYRLDGKRSQAPFPSVIVVFRPGRSA